MKCKRCGKLMKMIKTPTRTCYLCMDLNCKPKIRGGRQ